MKKAELISRFEGAKRDMEEEIRFFRGRLEEKDVSGSLRQYVLGRLTGLECAYEKIYGEL